MKSKNLLVISMVFLSLLCFAQKEVTNVYSNHLDWSRIQTIDNNDNTPNGFGYSVDIEGDKALVGDWYRSRVYYYKLDELGNWQQKQILEGAAKSYFGFDICMKNNTAFIGAPIYYDISNFTYNGRVYIFEYDPDFDSWSPKQVLIPKDYTNGDWFGRSVSFDNNIAVIGASGWKNNSQQVTGAAYICTKLDGTWKLSEVIPNPLSNSEDDFGYRVCVTGNKIAVSAPWYNYLNRPRYGAVCTFIYENGTVNQGETILYLSESTDRFGMSLKFLNDDLIIGGYTETGAAVLCYKRKDVSGLIFGAPIQKIEGTDEETFGSSIDFDENHLVIGGPTYHHYSSPYTGCIYIFNKVGSFWESMQKEKNYCFDKQAFNFGNAVCIDDDHILVGAPLATTFFDDESFSNVTPSSVYFYKKTEQGLTADAGEDKTICSGESVTLGGENVAQYGNEGYRYYWTDNNGWYSTVAKPTVSPSVTTTYTLSVIDCDGVGNIVHDDVTITVGCVLPVTYSGDDDPYQFALGVDNTGNAAVGGIIYGSSNYMINTIVINNTSYSGIAASSNGSKYLARFNSEGCVDWMHIFCTGSDDAGIIADNSQQIKFDQNGNLYFFVTDCAEHFESDIQLNPPSSISNKRFGWLGKFDTEGNLVYGNYILYADSYTSTSLNVTDNGIYASLDIGQSTTIGGNLVGPGIILIKYNNITGNVEWARLLSNNTEYHSCVTDNAGNIVFIASTSNQYDPVLQILRINSSTGETLDSYTLPLPFSGQASVIEIEYNGNQNYYIRLIEDVKVNNSWTTRRTIIRKLIYDGDTFTLDGSNYIVNSMWSSCYCPFYTDDLMCYNNGSIFVNTPVANYVGIVSKLDENLVFLTSTAEIYDLKIVEANRNCNDFGYINYGTSDYEEVYLNKFSLEDFQFGCTVEKAMSITTQASDMTTLLMEEKEIEITPNPADTYVDINISPIPLGFVLLELIDINGRTISKIETSGYNEKIRYDLSGVNPGIYMIKVLSQDRKYSSLIIKK